ncbi:MAG TPA: hypothetical protein VKB29_00870 [Candidatus Binataceae bacterium]|nr:hypothetical protein [Candidatus Binataceae bacterium]
MGRIRSPFLATSLAAALVIFVAGGALAQDASAPVPQASSPASTMQVQQPENGVNWPGAGYGAVALFGNLLYFPAKLVYAILGTIVGGGTYLVTAGNAQAASTVFRSALGGDYVLTPQMVAGQQPINFSGPTQTPPAPTATTADGSGSGTVQPIPPLPPPSSAPAAVPSMTSGTSQPMDAGTGPAHLKAESGAPKTSIE